jgi:hypothetical protein
MLDVVRDDVGSAIVVMSELVGEATGAISELVGTSAGAVTKLVGTAKVTTVELVGTARATTSELVGTGLVGTIKDIAAACEGTVDGSVGSSGSSSDDCPGAAAVGPSGASFGDGAIRVDDVGIELIVPIADVAAASVVDVFGAATGCSVGCSAEVVDELGGGGGAAAAVLVCTRDASSAVVDVVTSVGVTTAVSAVVLEVVAAVRARERIHRLPFTVVTDSCGLAMRATAHRKRRQQGLRRIDEENGL